MEITKNTRKKGFVSTIKFTSLTKGQAIELIRRCLSPEGLTVESGGIVLMIAQEVDAIQLAGARQKRVKNHAKHLLKMIQEHDYNPLAREYNVWVIARYNPMPDHSASHSGRVKLLSHNNMTPEEVQSLQKS